MDASVSFAAPRQLLLDIKRAVRTLRPRTESWKDRVQLCLEILDGQPNPALAGIAAGLSTLSEDEKHYWIGSLYALLLPDRVRKDQATFFTPPSLARGVLDLARHLGFDDAIHTVVDPAAGGAAFLSTVAGHMRAFDGTGAATRLHGLEIDPGLAVLSQALVERRLGLAKAQNSIIRAADSLRTKVKDQFDLVVANPPFGRLSSSQAADLPWDKVCHPGHINKYALFVELCMRLARPGGLIALVLPSSFLGGPLYGKLRTYIRRNAEVKVIASVAGRQDFFIDVAQDVSVLVLKATATPTADNAVSFGRFGAMGAYSALATSALPVTLDAPWTTPTSAVIESTGGSKLSDYGIGVRAGYFVWNRETARMRRRRAGSRDIPLIWGKNIKRGSFCVPASRKGTSPDFVHFDEPSPGIIRDQALVIQRTTNNAQARRLIVARVKPAAIEKWGGFVAENHVIVLTGASATVLNDVCFLLNSASVDARYRQVSGTASISVTLLRNLDLPNPHALAAALAEFGRTEAAIEEAYKSSRATGGEPP